MLLRELQVSVLATARLYADTFSSAPAFKAYDSAEALLTRLTESTRLDGDRAQLVIAMLGEYQRTGSPLWSGSVLVACYPMLSALRRRLSAPREMLEELDGLVVESFLAAAARVTVGDGALVRLRHATQDAVYAAIETRRHTRAVERDYRATLPRPVIKADAEVRASLVQIANDKATLGGLDSLRKEVEKAHGDVPELERRRVYERLKKQRTRARARLRTTFSEAA